MRLSSAKVVTIFSLGYFIFFTTRKHKQQELLKETKCDCRAKHARDRIRLKLEVLVDQIIDVALT